MTVLHTKYRPRDFDEVIGQQAIVKSLAAVLDANASHAFLFIGPSGVGKTTLARIAAARLGVEPSDIREIDAATYTGIADMRSITASLQYKPLGGSVRAIVLDECHALSPQAWQSLLRPLEEPPEWVYWMLCTTDDTKVPETIKTRCTVYRLTPVHPELIEKRLVDIAGREGLHFPDGVITLCAREADGSPREALVHLAKCAKVKSRAEAAALLGSMSVGGKRRGRPSDPAETQPSWDPVDGPPQLLADIRAAFESEGRDAIGSDRLAEFLGKLKQRPWAKWGKRQEPISKVQLAGLLDAYAIKPNQIWIDGHNLRGYELHQFHDAIERYLGPAIPAQTARTLGPAENKGISAKNETLARTRLASRNKR